MHKRYTTINGFLDTENKSELDKLKDHEINLQRQASSIRQMLNQIDDSFFGPIDKPPRKQHNHRLQLSHIAHGWEEAKRTTSSSVALSSSISEENNSKITETQRYIQSLKNQRTAAVKERIHERAQMLEQMEDMRQHALILARKKEAEALADKFYLQKSRERVLRRLQDNANHRLRQSYAVICNNLHRQRKALSHMYNVLHERCVMRAKGLVYHLRVGWKRFIDVLTPRIRNHDWLFVLHERAVAHHRQVQLYRLFSELSNTKRTRSTMYAKARQCYKNLSVKRLMKALRQQLDRHHRTALLSDILSKICSRKVNKNPSFLVESCLTFYGAKRKRNLKSSRIVGSPLLRFIVSSHGNKILSEIRCLRLFADAIARQSASASSLERSRILHNRQLFRRSWQYWKEYISRRHWFEQQPSAPLSKQTPGPLPKGPGQQVGRAKARCRRLRDRLFYHRTPCASLQRYIQIWQDDMRELLQRRTRLLPVIQQHVYHALSTQLVNPATSIFQKSSPIRLLLGGMQLRRGLQIFRSRVSSRSAARSITHKADGMLEARLHRRMRAFLDRLRKRMVTQRSVRTHRQRRLALWRRAYVQSILERLRTNVHRQKLHRMGLRYYQQCVYARFLESIHQHRVTRTRHVHTLQISPRQRRLLYGALHHWLDRARQCRWRRAQIRLMRTRIYSDMLRKYVHRWIERTTRGQEQDALYRRGKRHVQARRRRQSLERWVHVVETGVARRAQRRHAAHAMLPRLARYCLHTWRAAASDRRFFDVAQYQRGRALWTSLLQRRYLRRWAENVEDAHELDERVGQFARAIQSPLRLMRAWRLWSERRQARRRQAEAVEVGVDMAVRREARVVLRAWQTRVCTDVAQSHERYDRGRRHCALQTLGRAMDRWCQQTAASAARAEVHRTATRFREETKQLRPAWRRWRQLAARRTSNSRRRANHLVRTARLRRAWARFSMYLTTTTTSTSTSTSSRFHGRRSAVRARTTALAKHHLRRRLTERQRQFLARLHGRVVHRRQTARARTFRRHQLLRRVFCRGFCAILEQYHAAHANEMQRARLAHARHRLRRHLRFWLDWGRRRRLRRAFLARYVHRRLASEALVRRWRGVFARQVVARAKAAWSKATVCYARLVGRRALRRRWPCFVARRRHLLHRVLLQLQLQHQQPYHHRLLPPPSRPTSAAAATASLWMTAEEAAQWTSPRLSREPPFAIRRARSTTTTTTTITTTPMAMVRCWLRARGLTSTRQWLSLWPSRVDLRRGLVARWRAVHRPRVAAQRAAVQRAEDFARERAQTVGLETWLKTMRRARRASSDRRDADRHLRRIRLQEALCAWRRLSEERAETRTEQSWSWALARARLVWDTWRSRCRGTSDGLWREVQRSSSSSNDDAVGDVVVRKKTAAESVAASSLSSVVSTTTGHIPPTVPNGHRDDDTSRVTVVVTAPMIQKLLPIVKTSSSIYRHYQHPSSSSWSLTRHRTTSATIPSSSVKSHRVFPPTMTASPWTREEVVAVVNRSDALAATRTLFYRHLLRRCPTTHLLRLGTRPAQADALRRAAHFHDTRRLHCACRRWRRDAARRAFDTDVVPRHARRSTLTRLWQHWRTMQREARRQRHDAACLADAFHVRVLLLGRRAWPAWTRVVRLAHAARHVRLHVRRLRRHVWDAWARVARRHRLLRRAVQAAGRRDTRRRLSEAMTEWHREVDVERRLAMHRQRLVRARTAEAIAHWRGVFHRRVKHFQRRAMARVRLVGRGGGRIGDNDHENDDDACRRRRVFAQLLRRLAVRYDERDWMRVASRFHTETRLRGTLVNLLALRRTRLAEALRTRHVFRRVRRRLATYRCVVRERQARSMDVATSMVLGCALRRWSRFATASLAKKFTFGVLPRQPQLMQSMQEQVSSWTPRAHLASRRRHVPPPPPHSSTSSSSTSSSSLPNTIGKTTTPMTTTTTMTKRRMTRPKEAVYDDENANDDVNEDDGDDDGNALLLLLASETMTTTTTLLRQYSTYYWQTREAHVFRRLRRLCAARRAERETQSTCADYFIQYQVHRAFHLRWLQTTVRRTQRLRKNAFVHQRYATALLVKRALRIWDASIHVRAWVRERRWQLAVTCARRMQSRRGLRTLVWNWMRRRHRQQQEQHVDTEQTSIDSF